MPSVKTGGRLSGATYTSQVSSKTRDIASGLVLLATDFSALLSAIMLAVVLRQRILLLLAPAWFPAELPVEMQANSWWVALIALFCLANERTYSRRLSFWREASALVRALSLAFIASFAFIALTHTSAAFSRTVLVLAYFISLLILPLVRYAVKLLLHYVGLWREPVLIMGAGLTGRLVAKTLHTDKYLGYEVAGFLDDDRDKAIGVVYGKSTFPVVGGFADAPQYIKEQGIRHVILAAPGISGAEKVRITNAIQPLTRFIWVIPNLVGAPVANLEAEYFLDTQIPAFSMRNNLAEPANMAVKRGLDIVVSLLILPVILPLLALIIVAVRADSAGPAIYSGHRLGQNGKLFKCYKFRTMSMNNDAVLEQYLSSNHEAREEWVKFAKLKGYDPRVTRIGRLLRKLSLDELPQIINVLRGDMSLVGPRPYLPREKTQMKGYVDTILLTRPGITGLWQVSGRNEIEFEGRLQLDESYVRTWSAWLDITLMIKTSFILLTRKGAY